MVFNIEIGLISSNLILIMVKTPAEIWQDRIVQYRKKCQSILQLSDSIRYTGVINAYGRTLTGIVRPNVKPLLKSEQVKNEFFIISTLMTLRKDTISAIGKLDYVLLQHQKVSIVIFQKDDMTYYTSIDRTEKNTDKIIESIKKII
jgi:ABC-type microcin C transport system duplicated ATPase subunit YejF